MHKLAACIRLLHPDAGIVYVTKDGMICMIGRTKTVYGVMYSTE